jgi:hypothetical protein
MSDDDRSHAVDVLTKALERLSVVDPAIAPLRSEVPIEPVEDS